MRRQTLAFCCCFTFLFVASSSKPWEDFTGNDERNNFIRYEVHANVIMTNRSEDAEAVRYYVHENSTRNNVQHEFRSNFTSEDNGSMQYEFHSTKNHGDGDQTPAELRAMNSTRVDDEGNSTLYIEPSENLMQVEDGSNLTSSEHLGKSTIFIIRLNDNRKDRKDNRKNRKDNRNVVPYEMCNSTCIPLCCPLGNRMVEEECTKENVNFHFPDVYEYNFDTNQSMPIGEKVDQVFQLSHHYPCRFGHYLLEPDKRSYDEYKFLVNGSLYLPYSMKFIDMYCLMASNESYKIAVCFKNEDPIIGYYDRQEYYQSIGLIISLPFLLSTFVVYSILPELRNMHGYTLRGYVGSLFVTYIFLAVYQLIEKKKISDTFCTIAAFIIYFSFLSSLFWLNVMCFNIWWTFRRFRSLQENVTQRERKKFVMYSIYVWGSASILTTICAIMNFVPSVPKELIRPEIGAMKCWFSTDEARTIYFYGPMSIIVICNICLFISTALKIIRHKKDTAHHLRSSESRRHDDNKQWFNLYLKLFIVMGIIWSMEIISWLFKSAPEYVWYLSDLINTLQGLIIFIIFVWKKKIKRLLLKRFGCQDRGIEV